MLLNSCRHAQAPLGFISVVMGLLFSMQVLAAQPIIHDAEYYIIEAQNGEQWAADNDKIDAKLAEIRSKNGGKPPNIVYILLDDVGFGEIGMPDFSVVRGYDTPQLMSSPAACKECIRSPRVHQHELRC